MVAYSGTPPIIPACCFVPHEKKVAPNAVNKKNR